MAKNGWRHLERAVIRPVSDRHVRETMRLTGLSEAGARAQLEHETTHATYWLNDIYQVTSHEQDGGLVWINIRRRDGGPILRDWRHFQAIKNDVLGPDCEAVELYPAEDRKVDTSNKYHLFGFRDPKFRFPFGFAERMISDDSSDRAGLKQRKGA
jgi:hypothetical protein